MVLIRSISIKNFALIDDIQVSFGECLNVITGETGSGKSIVLNALSLALGTRADLSAIRDTNKKCVVEVVFEIKSHPMEQVFIDMDLDYEPETYFRREILPSGKSRAFVNDTPVNLEQMRSLGHLLVDIHTQRQTISLTEPNFYVDLLDSYGGGLMVRAQYEKAFHHFRSTQKEYTALVEAQQQSQASYDYNKYQLDELTNLALYAGIQEELEEERNQLQFATDIEQALSQAQQIIREENLGVSDQVNRLKNILSKLEAFGKPYVELSTQIQNIWYELEDMVSVVENCQQNITNDPSRLEQLSQKLSSIYALQNKHKAHDVQGLLDKQSHLEKLCAVVDDGESATSALKTQMDKAEKEAQQLASKLSDIRTQNAPALATAIAEGLEGLGMEYANFRFDFEEQPSFTVNGKDKVSLFFSANKGIAFGALHKTASGGELSRIMLVIKSIMARHKLLPCLILDEIDTGVSGEMAKAMAHLMKQMSQQNQLIAITHLPQIAAVGDTHIKVFKASDDSTTRTHAKSLNREDRVVEIAQMLDGKQATKAARVHAEELLN